MTPGNFKLSIMPRVGFGDIQSELHALHGRGLGADELTRSLSCYNLTCSRTWYRQDRPSLLSLFSCTLLSMSAIQKLYCYVDETGQDTAGEFFLVSIVILDALREELKEWLQKLEKESGKGKKKWTKATRKQRQVYMEQIVADERFSE